MNQAGSSNGLFAGRPLRCAAITLIAVLTAFAVLIPGAAAQAPVTLEVWDWWSMEGIYSEWFDGYLKATFEERNPGVVVEFRSIGFGNYVDQLLTSIAGGVPPDVIAMSVAFARDLWEIGVLSDLAPYMERDPEFAPDKFIPTTQVYNQVDGHIYGATHYIDSETLVYNIQHFAEVGLDTSPFAIESWDAFREAARKLARHDGAELTRAGYGIGHFTPDNGIAPLAAWLAANGGGLYNTDLTAPDFYNERGVETLEFLTRLVHEDGTANIGGGALVNGAASMVNWHTGVGSYLRDANPALEFAMTSFPQGPSGTQRGTSTWGNMLGIPAASKNQDLAWKFVVHATSLEGNLAMMRLLGRPTAPRLAFYQSDEWEIAMQDQPWHAVIPEIVMAGGLRGLQPFLGGPQMIVDMSEPLWKAVAEASVPPTQALAEASAVMARALSD